jgi:8-oxo-dGTP pyrophosphatase MutT (NUDIX family)
MTERKNIGLIEAAGGIVERQTSQGPVIAVIYRQRYGGEYALPKGKRECGETLEQTALREVEEETGLKATIKGIAGATTYLANGVPKLVVYWRMKAPDEIAPFTPNNEVTRLDWLEPGIAIECLSHSEETDLVRRAFPWHQQTGFVLWLDWLAKRLVPVLRRRPWKRLASAITVYDGEVQARATSDRSLCAGLVPILNLLASARAALQDGDLEQSWKLFLTAQRVEILYLDQTELSAAAAAIRSEAEKLNAWRKAGVIATLAVKGRETLDAKRVFRAAALRDEHYHNEAYKDGLRRGNALRLAILLIAALMALFWCKEDLAVVASITANPTSLSGKHWASSLLSVSIVGLLGSIVSAITDVPRANASARIPEMASSVRVTVLRLLMGPASAIVLFFVIQSSISKSIVHLDHLDGYAILAIAFAAGFSERLVLRVVERIAGRTS